MTGYQDVSFHSWSGRVLAAVLAVIGALGVVSAFLNRGTVAGLVATAVWLVVASALYFILWRPRLDVLSDRIVVVNPVRTYDLPWSSVVSVESRWVLTLITSTGAVRVWAAPRPSSGAGVVGFRRDPYGRPDYDAQKLHQQQDGSSGSANAAMTVIQARLDAR